MKWISLIFFLFYLPISAQKEFPLVVKENTKEVFFDDFENVYLCSPDFLLFTKYDSSGLPKAQVKLPYPFRVQSVDNPLQIFIFSESGQEIKILDQNLNEIQTIPLYRTFGNIKGVYVEDLQYAWLLNSSQKSLIQYQYRDAQVIRSFPLKFDFTGVQDFLIFDQTIYVLKEKTFEVYDFNSHQIFEKKIENGRRLSRENNRIYIKEKSSISVYEPHEKYDAIFSKQNSTIVEKNTNHFLALIGDKFYLYQLEK